jgi:ABC-type multidrug transport system fused ATPase/permease subunit
MESTIHGFVLKHARRETAWIVLLTLLSLPVYYLSLDIPKTIMNEAIVGKGMSWPTTVFGFQFDQVGYLFLLCAAFLASVLVNGGLKQYISSMRGRLGERLLRRLRYELVTRTLRFPLPHFRKVSSAEVIPMITAEVEPIGGYMGDAFAQPLIQLGTLLTIVTFLFIQNPLMGLAAISLYPIQAYLIPKLQRRVNQLGKERVRAVRRLSERIGESIAGIQEIRSHGTVNFERATFAEHLGRIYEIRYEIFLRKGFVKFINNFLNQMAPLLFYSIGGYLVIHGDLTIGALTAALSANKDMSAPWKELLDWYQQTQDAKIKYEQVTEQFRPDNMVDEAMQRPLDAKPAAIVGPIALAGVGVLDDGGIRLLENVSLTIEPGDHVVVVGSAASGKDSFAQVLARLTAPTQGRVTWNGDDIQRMTEAAIGARIAYVGPASYMFSSSVRENLAFGLRQRPITPRVREAAAERERQRRLAENRRAGNSELDAEADWVDHEAAGLEAQRGFDERLVALLERVDLADDIYQFGLRGRVDPAARPETAEKILAARSALGEQLATPDLKALVEPFDAARYNTNATLAENLLFGTPTEAGFAIDALASNDRILAILERVGLIERLISAGCQVAETMTEIFADLPAGHELFAQYSFLTADELAELPALLGRAGVGGRNASGADRTRLLALPLKLIEARHRLGVIDAELKEKVLEARAIVRREIATGIGYFESDRYNSAATLQDNILFGKVAYGQLHAAQRVGKLIAETLDARGLRGAVLEVGLDFQVGVAGGQLSLVQRQKLAVARGLVKRPDLLIINEATMSLDAAAQNRVLDGVLAECSERTLVWVAHAPAMARRFARVLVFADGHLVEDGAPSELEREGTAFADLLKQSA